MALILQGVAQDVHGSVSRARCTHHVASRPHVASHHHGTSCLRVRRTRTTLECSFSAPEMWPPFSFFPNLPFLPGNHKFVL